VSAAKMILDRHKLENKNSHTDTCWNLDIYILYIYISV